MSLLDNKLDANAGAALTGLSANTLRVYARTGRLRHTKVLSRYFFDEKDLMALFKSKPGTISSEPHNNDTINTIE